LAIPWQRRKIVAGRDGQYFAPGELTQAAHQQSEQQTSASSCWDCMAMKEIVPPGLLLLFRLRRPKPPGTGAVGHHANTIGEAMGWPIEEYCARSIQGFAASKIGAHSAENFRQRVVAVKFEERKITHQPDRRLILN
jgi:hypothetical protein